MFKFKRSFVMVLVLSAATTSLSSFAQVSIPRPTPLPVPVPIKTIPERLSALEQSDRAQNQRISELISTISKTITVNSQQDSSIRLLQQQQALQQQTLDKLNLRVLELEKKLGSGTPPPLTGGDIFLLADTIAVDLNGKEPYVIKAYFSNNQVVYVNPERGSEMYKYCVYAAQYAKDNKIRFNVSVGPADKNLSGNGLTVYSEVYTCGAFN